jgi:hypothetical protein
MDWPCDTTHNHNSSNVVGPARKTRQQRGGGDPTRIPKTTTRTRVGASAASQAAPHARTHLLPLSLAERKVVEGLRVPHERHAL